MPSRLFLFVVFFGTFIPSPAADPPAPTPPPIAVTLKQSGTTLADAAAALAKSSGIAIEVDSQVAKKPCEVAFAGTPFWEALEQAASKAEARLVILDGGRKVLLVPRGASKEVSAVSGPFRVAAKQVIGRALLDTGVTYHDCLLEVHWEPRYPVFRIDSNPKIKTARDDKGTNLLADPAVTRQHPGSAIAEMKVKLTGLPREAKKIAVLEGEFHATAATRLLAFRFDDLNTKTPVTKIEDRVSVTLKPLTRDDTTGTWDVDLEMTYPEPHPVFESFEEHKWLRDHKLQLVVAGKPLEATSEDVVAGGRKVTATYRFKAMNPLPKGAAIVLQAPGPIVELTVPFKLQNITLP